MSVRGSRPADTGGGGGKGHVSSDVWRGHAVWRPKNVTDVCGSGYSRDNNR